MSYQEKKNIVSMASGLVLIIIYGINALDAYRSGTIGGADLQG